MQTETVLRVGGLLVVVLAVLLWAVGGSDQLPLAGALITTGAGFYIAGPYGDRIDALSDPNRSLSTEQLRVMWYWYPVIVVSVFGVLWWVTGLVGVRAPLDAAASLHSAVAFAFGASLGCLLGAGPLVVAWRNPHERHWIHRYPQILPGSLVLAYGPLLVAHGLAAVAFAVSYTTAITAAIYVVTPRPAEFERAGRD